MFDLNLMQMKSIAGGTVYVSGGGGSWGFDQDGNWVFTSDGGGSGGIFGGCSFAGSANESGLKQVELPGLGSTYLDAQFQPKVEQFIENAKTAGVDLTFNSAYRTPEKQESLKSDKNAITPADNSLHSAGFAVDVNFTSLKDIKGGLTGDEQRSAIKTAASDAGLNWGGEFKKSDPPHFYVDPGNRQELIEAATKKYKELKEADK